MPARSESLRRTPSRPYGKRDFANRVHGFANHVAALPGFPLLWMVSLAVAALMTVTGGFNTVALPLPVRAGFWLLLIGWNALKWQLWFALTVRGDRDWMRAALLGAIPINLPLPLEIAAALALFGYDMEPDAGDIWPRALAISVGIFLFMLLVGRRMARSGAREAAPVAAPPVDGLLHRAGIAPGTVLTIAAEDHYCRVRATGGASALVHYRFGDALAEMASLDGTQVRRGCWVAAQAVTGARREERRWRLLLVDGSSVPVSAAHLAEVRRRGWLRTPRP